MKNADGKCVLDDIFEDADLCSVIIWMITTIEPKPTAIIVIGEKTMYAIRTNSPKIAELMIISTGSNLFCCDTHLLLRYHPNGSFCDL